VFDGAPTDPLDADSDSDGLDDDQENFYPADPNDSDTDDDGISDGDEVNKWGTDPNAGPSLGDADTSVHADSIQLIGAAGITRGCNPPLNDLFCPNQFVSREEMATFLVRALQLPPTSIDYFDDDNGSVHEDSINRVAAAGITRGCNPPANTQYCGAAS
jgi:hypothetical protein